ncbi:flagellar basal body rod protein FlgC [Rubrimonas cliftonensis]|uniref:Flagellar basal-body rod protein FlgC n=1 Tax=Rubrimonas cliftonensis TaxID=89524 RepID=A0A1H4F2K7_9RHOB|nr:flagellar basal body rod protein FlgC [Rubrimonas cliftonensis]SEA91544.1 flagellar basal-body rod protein FlgC [Rubrimonas cliftonensis]
MVDFSDVQKVASSGMQAQSQRLRVIAENIANADTPGFRRKMLAFGVERGTGGVAVDAMAFDNAELPKVYDPSHPMADAEGYYEGSSVRLMVEVADAREAQRSYEANLRIFDQTRRMSASVLDLIKR